MVVIWSKVMNPKNRILPKEKQISRLDKTDINQNPDKTEICLAAVQRHSPVTSQHEKRLMRFIDTKIDPLRSQMDKDESMAVEFTLSNHISVFLGLAKIVEYIFGPSYCLRRIMKNTENIGSLQVCTVTSANRQHPDSRWTISFPLYIRQWGF